MASTATDPDATPPPRNKRRRPPYNDDDDDDNERVDPDIDRTPRGRATLSSSGRTSSRSSGASRISATRRLAHLEIAPVNPVLVTQISRSDARMPKELADMLDALEGFQSRVGIVPDYLAVDIEARAKEDRELYNFQPSKFYQANKTTTDAPVLHPDLSLDRALELFSAAKECFNESHAEATWNTLVHWPVFQLALGPIETSLGAPADGIQYQRRPACVRAMPCATARLQGRPHGAKMVDYCIFVEPQGEDAHRVDQIREVREYINHTDYSPLRRRPIVLSAESKKPGEGYKDAQIQLSVWQAAQWALLESLLASRPTQSALIPFLPALIIQGHEWSFAATTKSGRHTVCILSIVSMSQCTTSLSSC